MFKGAVNLTEIPEHFRIPNGVKTSSSTDADCSDTAMDGTWCIRPTNTESMFEGCTSFNSMHVANMVLSDCLNAKNMFKGCTSFNQPLGDRFALGKASSLESMFDGCTAFDQPVAIINGSCSTSFHRMFADCTVFNQPIGDLCFANADDVSFMLHNAINFNQSLEDVYFGCENFESMFEGCTSFNGNVNMMFTPRATNMTRMFKNTNIIRNFCFNF
jgi:hypothetical protein